MIENVQVDSQDKGIKRKIIRSYPSAPDGLQRMFPSVPDTCWRYLEIGALIFIFSVITLRYACSGQLFLALLWFCTEFLRHCPLISAHQFLAKG